MIIPHVLLLLLRQAEDIVSSTRFACSVFSSQDQQHAYSSSATQPDQAKTDAEADRVVWRLRCDEDVACDDAAGVSEANLHGHGYSAFVVSTDVVVEPDDGDRLSNVAAAGDEVQGEVAGANGDRAHVEKDDVADCGDAAADHDEGEAAFEAVCEIGDCERADCGGDVDWNAHDLCSDSFPPELSKDCGCEKGSSIAGIYNAEIHEDSAVYLEITKYALCSVLVPRVHLCICRVIRQSSEER